MLFSKRNINMSDLKIFSWNCQGLGNPYTRLIMKQLISKHMPTIVFLMETKVGLWIKYMKENGNFSYQQHCAIPLTIMEGD